MYFQYDTNGTPLGFIYNGAQYFYVTNQMGDVIVIIGADGDVICQYLYDEWGKVLGAFVSNEDNTEYVTVANANPIRYRGYYYDTETEYYYLQSRYYAPSICRFINADIPEIASIGKDISVGTNLFAYCNNDSVNNSDPTGAFGTPIQWVFAAIGAIAGWYLGDYVARKLGYSSGWKYWTIRAGVIIGGAVIGWFAASVLTAILKSFIFSSPKIVSATPLWVYKFLGIATGSSATVLGRYPVYLEYASKVNANVFCIAKNVWNSMSEAARWAANQAFLYKAVQAGQKFTLTSNAYTAKPGTYFYKEIQFLLNHGYKIVEYGWAMIKK